MKVDTRVASEYVENEQDANVRWKCFGFLDLPAELRNSIYTFAIYEAKSIGDDTFSCPYLGLTQVCKQLRFEFRPMYMNACPVILPDSDVHEYLDIFLPGWNYSLSAPKQHLRPRVKISSFRTVEDDGADLTPVIHLMLQTPGVRFETTNGFRCLPLRHGLQAILDARESWQALSTTNFTSFCLQLSRSNAYWDRVYHFKLLFSESFEASWILGNGKVNHSGARTYLKRLGFLGHDESPPVHIGTYEQRQDRGVSWQVIRLEYHRC